MDGYKLTEIGFVPVEWQSLALNELAFVIDGDRGSNYPDKSELKTDGFCLFLNAGNVTKTGFRFSKCEFISIEKDKKLRKGKLERGDIVLTTRGSIGHFANFNNHVPYENVRLNSGMVSIRSFAKEIDSGFLYVQLRSNSTSKQIEALSFGSAQPQLTVKGINTIRLAIPPKIIEQKAIAKALSDTDALITALEKLIAKKRAIKTATMQQLLTGKTRLPGFGEGKGYKDSELGRIPEDWDVRHLGSLLAESPSYGINAPAVKLTAGLPTYLRITDISDDGQFNTTVKVGVDHADSSRYVLNIGDVVFARTGASVGKSYIHKSGSERLVFAGFLIKVVANDQVLDPEYLFQYCKTRAYWNWIELMSMRSGQPGVNGNELKRLRLVLPCLEEQRCIANHLIVVDDEIGKLINYRKKMTDVKTAMMQQLLTGRTRLV